MPFDYGVTGPEKKLLLFLHLLDLAKKNQMNGATQIGMEYMALKKITNRYSDVLEPPSGQYCFPLLRFTPRLWSSRKNAGSNLWMSLQWGGRHGFCIWGGGGIQS